eukprot:scaffold119133_cov23-Tisochrysis_lutea.AAC.1
MASYWHCIILGLASPPLCLVVSSLTITAAHKVVALQPASYEAQGSAQRPSHERGLISAASHALPDSQLANWVRYLDHMESKKDASVSDVATVYERCLVPCASYP